MNPGASKSKLAFPDSPSLEERRRAGLLARAEAPSGMARKPAARPSVAKAALQRQLTSRERRHAAELDELRSIQAQAVTLGATAKERVGVTGLAKKHQQFLLDGLGITVSSGATGRERSRALVAAIKEADAQMSGGTPAGPACP